MKILFKLYCIIQGSFWGDTLKNKVFYHYRFKHSHSSHLLTAAVEIILQSDWLRGSLYIGQSQAYVLGNALNIIALTQ